MFFLFRKSKINRKSFQLKGVSWNTTFSNFIETLSKSMAFRFDIFLFDILVTSISLKFPICCYNTQLKAYRFGCQEFMSNSSVDQKLLFSSYFPRK